MSPVLLCALLCILESHSLNILTRCKKNLDESVDSSTFSKRNYPPFICKGSLTLVHGLEWGFLSSLILYLKTQTCLTYGSFNVKSTNPPHLTLMDFAEILLSQCTHQEIKILKILLTYHVWFQN